MVKPSVVKKTADNDLMQEIKKALKNINGWGSVEIYIQDYKVVQITERNIRKTNHKNGSGFTIQKSTS
jgi:hypothetical protein